MHGRRDAAGLQEPGRFGAQRCRSSVVQRLALAVSASIMIALLMAPAPGHAATPFNVGTGTTPQVAVGPDGVGHVVWQIDDTGDRIGYCRVPKNASACDVTLELSYPNGGSATGRGYPQVFAPAAGRIAIVGACYTCPSGITSRIFRWISITGGASFGPPAEIANNLAPEGQGAYVEPGNVAIAIGEPAGGGTGVLAGPTALTTRGASVLPGGYGFSPAVVRVPGQDQLVAAASNQSAISFSVFSGPLTPDNINNPVNWSGGQPPTAPVDDDDPSLGEGGAGAFLTFTRFIPNNSQVIVQRYDPTTKTFGAPVPIEGPSPIDDDNAGDSDVAGDSAGLQVIWKTNHDGGRLRYRRSTNAGASYGPVLNIAARDTFVDPQIAVAPDGSGFAAWKGIGNSTVKVVALDPQPEPVGGPPPPPPPPPPPVYAGKTKAVKVSDRNASFSLTVPRDCVQPGHRFDATLKAKRKKRKGNVFVKVFRADFYLGSERVKIDRKAPFVHRYQVRVTQPRGSTIKLRVRAFIKVRRGKTPKKSLRATIKICS